MLTIQQGTVTDILHAIKGVSDNQNEDYVFYNLNYMILGTR